MPEDSEIPEEFQQPVELPITDELDLHTFHPRDVKDLLTEYLNACQERGILAVRVIHGKGIGQLRRTVHAALEKNPQVLSFQPASEQMGSWGATMVFLRPSSSSPPD